MPKAKPSEAEQFPYVSRVDAAKLLTVGVQQIDKLVRAKVLTPYYVGRKVIFRREEVLHKLETGGFPVLTRSGEVAR
jgi:excisionase family DNA binding protein